MSRYSITDLLELLISERGDCLRLEVGLPPTLVVQGEAHEVEGPVLEEEAVEAMLRSVASSRELRVFRETGCVDIIATLKDGRFLVRAVRAFHQFRLELLPIS